jgi:dCTP deaminase
LALLSGMIMPFKERFRDEIGNSGGLGPCGYDVILAEKLTIKPGDFVLASTTEHFVLPEHVMLTVHDKSTFVRQGLTVQNTVAEPGWRGYLTLELMHHGVKQIHVPAGCAIAQVVFQYLDHATLEPYAGKYQDQAPGPQPSRWYGDEGKPSREEETTG